MKTGEKIRNRRIALNMTMEDLGRAIGVQRSAINKYEKGLVDIKSKTLTAIANALNISPLLLMDDIEGEDVEQYVTEIPQTVEARSLAKGIDKMPQAQREAIMNMMIGLYPGLFEKGTDENDT